MLRRARETRDPPDKSVVTAVRAWARLGKQLVEPMRRPIAERIRYIDPNCTKSRRGHRYKPRLGRFAPGVQIVDPGGDDFVTWKA